VDRGGREGDLDRLTSLVDEGADRFHRAVDDLRNRHTISLQRDLVARHAADVQQVVRESGQLPDLAFEHARHCLQVGVVRRFEAQRLAGRPQGGQRIAQLVRQHREELVLAACGLRERGGALADALFQFLVRPAQRLAHALPLADLALQLEVHARQRAALAIKIDEDRDLGAQNLGVQRFGEIVHGADMIAALLILRVEHPRREEQDGDLSRALAPLDHRRQIEPAHPRHHDVEHDREVLIEQREQRFIGRLG
jgi:hypothetical protein